MDLITTDMVEAAVERQLCALGPSQFLPLGEAPLRALESS
jgi:hypothetical protein